MATKRDPTEVEYRPPGSTEWQPVRNFLPKVEGARSDRARVRRLLAEGESTARRILLRSRNGGRSEGEVAELERDMAAALGSFERFVAAGARKLKYDAEDVIRDLRGRKK